MGMRRRQRFIGQAKTRRVRDSLVNSKAAVDIFLWKGSPNPRIVQRIGAWLFGLFFCTVGAVMIGDAQEERSVFLGAVRVGMDSTRGQSIPKRLQKRP